MAVQMRERPEAVHLGLEDPGRVVERLRDTGEPRRVNIRTTLAYRAASRSIDCPAKLPLIALVRADHYETACGTLRRWRLVARHHHRTRRIHGG